MKMAEGRFFLERGLPGLLGQLDFPKLIEAVLAG